MYEACMALAAKKYRAFPYTGLEIMQAYAGDAWSSRCCCFFCCSWSQKMQGAVYTKGKT